SHCPGGYPVSLSPVSQAPLLVTAARHADPVTSAGRLELLTNWYGRRWMRALAGGSSGDTAGRDPSGSAASCPGGAQWLCGTRQRD
ncbi:unnamed protein product, partial [Urochloa humidicola]